jgi:hypothetical protein
MQIVDVLVEFTSGVTISDRGTFLVGSARVQVSAQMADVLRLLSDAGLPPKVTARINGEVMPLEPDGIGMFRIAKTGVGGDRPIRFWWVLATLVKFPTRDQRQQFGRFMHTLSAAALIGAIGLWHSTSNWTATSIQNEINLFLAFVVTFYAGMVSMNGE